MAMAVLQSLLVHGCDVLVVAGGKLGVKGGHNLFVIVGVFFKVFLL